MANELELQRSRLEEQWMITKGGIRSCVRQVNRWEEWVYSLPEPVSSIFQLIDFGYPQQAQIQEKSYVMRLSKLLGELRKIVPRIPGNYSVDPIYYHPHAQGSEAKFTGKIGFRVGDDFCDADFCANELMVRAVPVGQPDRIEIRDSEPSVLNLSLNKGVRICLSEQKGENHQDSNWLLWYPEVSTEQPVPLLPFSENHRWLNLGVFEPFTRLVLQKDEWNRRFNVVEDNFSGDLSKYSQAKRIGVFLVYDNIAQFNWSEVGIKLDEGDRFIDFHLPENGDYVKGLRFLRGVTNSFRLMAEYIRQHNLNPKLIFGATDEKLALVSRRYGFTTTELPVEESYRKYREENFRKDNPRGKDYEGKEKDMGKILALYQPTGQFLERFGRLKMNGDYQEEV